MVKISYQNQKQLNIYVIKKNSIFNSKKELIFDLPFYLPKSDNQTIEDAVVVYANSITNSFNLQNLETGVRIIG